MKKPKLTFKEKRELKKKKSYKDIEDEKFQDVVNYIDYLKKNPN